MIPVQGQVKTDLGSLMDARGDLSLAEQLAAAEDWWREAGVDCLFDDEATDWLAKLEADQAAPYSPQGHAAPHAQARRKEESAEPPVATDGLPSDLAAFAQWWLTEPSLDPGGPTQRIAPRGAEAAELMILVPMPEAEDRETLLSGPQGRLVANMLRALDLDAERAYIASALPRHMALPDWAALAHAGLGTVLAEHAGLVRPQRLLVLGREVGPLLNAERPRSAVWTGSIEAGGKPIATLVSYGPETLLHTPRFRKNLWQHLLDFTGGNA